jgi:nucleotide-binding universal stress UspA family protein
MYGTVLWATDASPLADGALTEALRLLQPGGRLIVFHCDERFLGGRASGLPALADENDRRKKLAAQVEHLQEKGIDAELVIDVTHHDRAGEIAKAADTMGADAIVCGTRGFGVVAGTVAGSVALRLPHLAVCPVVVVSERAAARATAS